MRCVWVVEQRYENRWLPWCFYGERREAQQSLGESRQENPAERREFRVRKYVPAAGDRA